MPLAVGFIALFVASWLVQFVLGLVRGAIASVLGLGRAGFSGGMDSFDLGSIMNTMSWLDWLFSPIQYLINTAISAYLMAGLVSFALQVMRGQKPPLNEVFNGGRYFPPMLIASILYSLGVGIGFAFCIVPGVVLAIGFAVYQPALIDRGTSGVESLRESWRLTKGQWGNVFVLLLLLFLIGIAGFLACCIGLALVSAPLTVLTQAYVYLKLKGEEPTLPAPVPMQGFGGGGQRPFGSPPGQPPYGSPGQPPPYGAPPGQPPPYGAPPGQPPYGSGR
jgi:hypothetical protein